MILQLSAPPEEFLVDIRYDWRRRLNHITLPALCSALAHAERSGTRQRTNQLILGVHSLMTINYLHVYTFHIGSALLRSVFLGTRGSSTLSPLLFGRSNLVHNHCTLSSALSYPDSER
ncbi:hypothetical protein DAEQUDRAFT_139917 [Daedalea quercina L-15889]|uniref:Uncharacterized protein n=1 Tax=Daedalea quercina L-15889 TaxID=1314783 RepID=A0A165RTQ6_9APHY|nr:hypothetical protein DAEQUDRAFT_139917 [Daedalea quercina L-15889]